MKTDPYGFACEKRPANASIVTNLQEYRWNDDKWLAKRSKRDYTKEPMNIYEVHLGSWKRQQGTEDGFVGVYRVITGKIVFLKRLFDSVEEERGCDVDGDGNGGGGKRLHCSFRFHRSDSGLHVFTGE